MDLPPFKGDPKVEALQIARYRYMSDTEKFLESFSLTDAVRRMQLEAIRVAHPDADEFELKMRLASRWCDHELLKKAFGWDVAEKGY
jgi:hypothetical protein